MTTKCISLEYPRDGRRKATIVTDEEYLCRYLELDPDAEIDIIIKPGKRHTTLLKKALAEIGER